MFLNPKKIIENLRITSGMTVADFGSGAGFYSIETAKAVGLNGVVYSLDIRKDLLAALKSRAKMEGIQNIETIWADLEKENAISIKSESVDLVIISNILFQAIKKQVIIKEAKNILKPHGLIGTIEWSKVVSKIGPPVESRISKEETIKLFQEAGFKFEREFHAGDQHYGLVFRKIMSERSE